MVVVAQLVDPPTGGLWRVACMFWVSVLKSELTGKIYVGQTRDLETRLKRHNGILFSKASSYTFRNKGPWVLEYSEKFDTRREALVREKELKSYKGREFIQEILGDS